MLVNEVSYKTLGFLPGSVKQEGEITPISSDTFEVRLGGGLGEGWLNRAGTDGCSGTWRFSVPAHALLG